MPLVILNIIAIANLLILFLLLLVVKPRTPANRLLAAIMLNPVFSMLLILAIYYKQADHYPALFYLSYLYDLLWAPLFYYVFRLMLHQGIRFSFKKHILHFSFFIAGCLYFMAFALHPETYRHQIFAKTLSGNYPWQLYLLDYLTIVQVGLYLFIIYKMVRKYNRHIEQVFSNTQQISAKRIERNIVLAFFLCAVIYFPSMINVKGMTLYMIFVPICSIILYCYLVYNAISSPLVFRQETLEILRQTKDMAVDKEEQKQMIIEDDTHIQLTKALEMLLIKKKLFLDPELNIQVLAEQCKTRIHILSAFINKHYSKNFFDYINYYRIEEAKKLLSDPTQKKYSIDTIAEKSGFSSRSAFYKAFKKNTELTPGEYITKTAENSLG
ncbi:MAG: helix-turn-helix domain-containing protein [Bacteroidales bacterium]|nr:helix-turn-helix domain-containing protein [Bacteroidales bacterium]